MSPGTRLLPHDRRSVAGLAARAFAFALLCLAMFMPTVMAADGGLLDQRFRPLAGKTEVHLGQTYGGKVLLVVNTASKCGFTPQFDALESLHARLAPRGFAVLGFPSGDFAGQEYADEKKIREFCRLTYGVKFPMFQKVHVVGDDAVPFYKALAAATGKPPKWNFHKYLIGRDGKVAAVFGSRTAPDAPEVLAAIERALAAPAP